MRKNRKPIARKKPLPRSATPLKRSRLKARRLLVRALGKPRKRIKTRGRSRFPKHRQPAYKAWIKTLPCALLGKPKVWGSELFARTHDCREPIDPMHVKSRGAGADDLGALIPCCHSEHERSHRTGIKTWATEWFGEYGFEELRRIAAEVYPAQWLKQKELGWPS